MLSADNQQERLPVELEYLKWYIAGFVDGEGCFSVSIRKSKFSRLKWTINPLFQVYQHKKNALVLSLCQQIFECGYISDKGGNPSCKTYCVDKIQDLTEKVIPFFNKHPLLGQKQNNVILFEQIIEGMRLKQHLNPEGFFKLAELAFQMNDMGKYRKVTLSEIKESLAKSSETIRQTSLQKR